MKTIHTLLVAIAISLTAQILARATPVDSKEPIGTKLKMAQDLFDLGLYDSALTSYISAEKLFTAARQWDNVVLCKNSIAEIYRIVADNAKCEATLNESYEICKTNLPPNSEGLAKTFEVHGKMLDYNVRDFEQARLYYEKALAMRSQLYGKEHLAIAENIYLIGRTYLNTGKFDDAEKLFREAVAMKTKLGGAGHISLYDVHISQGVLYRRWLRFEEALVYYQKAQDIWNQNKRSNEHPNYGLLLYGMGNLCIESGLYEDARINYEHAVRIFEKSYGEYDHRVGVTYTNIGACYANQLEFYSAIQYHNKAYTIFQQILEPNHPFISALYVDFSDSYAKMGKHQESLEFGKKALDVLKSRYPTKEGRDHREMGIAYYRYGNTLIKIGQYKDAIAHLNSAIDEFNLMEEKQLLSHVYVLLGMTNSYLQKKQEAENNFQHAIDILAKEKTTPKNLHLVYALSAYAEFCNDEKKYSQALELCNKAMAQLGIATKGQYDFYFAENLYSVDYLTDLLHERGMALWGLYKKEGDQNILHTALKNYSFLTDVYQLVIQESKAERSKLLQLPSLAEYYEKAVVCALELFEKTKDIRFKHQAFAFAEQSKAILLRHYIHDSQARSYAGIPSTIIQQERRLKEKISFIEKRMTELDNTAENDSLFKLLQRAHFTAKIRYDSLLNGIENNYPAYHTLKYKKNYIEANQLMKLMAPGKAVLEYLVGTDNIYAFLITHNSVDVVTMANEAAATINASALREGLVSRDMEKYSKNAIAFYERIFKPVEPLIQQHQVSALTVIPDGFISYIPLEALISDMQGDQYRYLLQDYTFNYQFSAGLIPEYRNVRRPASGKQFLGFAPSFGTPTSAPESLSPLAFAREEVEFISTRFHGENFLDLTATETNFKSNAPYYNIVHIATHAVIDDDNADLSRLYFSIPGDSTDDGRLHAYELFNMQIQASLITLSACNTGVGTLHKGEGVMSLSRAFAYAGCPSIVTSLWQAQDKSTAAIMKYFYENLAAGADKASALRQAKLQYLQDADKVKAIPFYWAGFILVGDESPLNRPINYAWFLLTAPALVIVLYGFRKFRKRNNVVAS